MSTRRHLPARRPAVTRSATVGTTHIHLTVGEYPDGTPGELFIDVHREGAPFRAVLNVVGRLASLALQHGVPLEEVAGMFRESAFEPAGEVQGHEGITSAASLVDYVGQALAADYLPSPR